jgi:uracil-DNA glycosylase
MLETLIGKSWVDIIGEEFKKEYLLKLSAWLQYQRKEGTKEIYPASEDVFRALKECPYGQVKVVIVGKSPYYQPGVADGLAFSYKGGLKHIPGLQALDIIIDEIERDCYNGFEVNQDYDLTYLAKQGVLLLNSVLTTAKGSPDAHKGLGWEIFIKKIIDTQLQERSPKVFMLWGKEAQDNLYNTNHVRTHDDMLFGHLIINARHPAADLHNRDALGQVVERHPDSFSGGHYFSKANEFLVKNGLTPIDWLNTKEPFFNKSLQQELFLNDKGYPKIWD